MAWTRPAQRLLIGPWHPPIRDALDLLRLTYLAGAIVFAAAGQFESALRLAVRLWWCDIAVHLSLTSAVSPLFTSASRASSWSPTSRSPT